MSPSNARLRGSVIIPAHNEGRVISRLLDPLAQGGLSPDIQVIVVANGCTDDTVAVAERYGASLGVQVVQVDRPSKTAALNEGDRLATDFPRLYLDADVEVDARAIEAVLDVLARGGIGAARPPLRYLTDDAGPLVRAFYRARSRTPPLMSAVWGAGFVALSEEVRERWGPFPVGHADDLLVAEHVRPGEFVIVDTTPVSVRVPRTTRALLRTLRRVYALPGRLDAAAPASATGSTLRALARANASPRHWADAVVYAALVTSARLSTLGPRPTGWARDDTTR